MRSFISLFTGALIVIFSALAGFAQAQPASIKVAFLNTEVFYDEKAGITKLINANKQLDTEFGARIKELQDGNVRLQTIATELQNMQKLPQQQFNQVAFTNKQDEGQRLQRELEYKKTELESAIGKRRQVLVAPISQDVGKAIDEFAKKNGYGAIFDVSKLADSGALMFLAEGAEITKEFITFYNARPATAATTPAKPD